MIYKGSCWYGGKGVDIYANGGNTHGTKWQCTELARRFWWSKGWASKSWNGGYGSILWNYKTPAGAVSQPQGSITKLAAGDILSMDQYLSGGGKTAFGHVGVVNSISSGTGGTYTVQMASQNTPQAMWYFQWDGSSIKPIGAGFSNFKVTGVLHHNSSQDAKTS